MLFEFRSSVQKPLRNRNLSSIMIHHHHHDLQVRSSSPDSTHDKEIQSGRSTSEPHHRCESSYHSPDSLGEYSPKEETERVPESTIDKVPKNVSAQKSWENGIVDVTRNYDVVKIDAIWARYSSCCFVMFGRCAQVRWWLYLENNIVEPAIT
jgi:hypothetical protein